VQGRMHHLSTWFDPARDSMIVYDRPIRGCGEGIFTQQECAKILAIDGKGFL
jgi:hypothetical protein